VTIEQRQIVNGLHQSNLASYDKNFIFRMYYSAANFELSEKQNALLYQLLYKYKDQVHGLYEQYKNNEHCKKQKINS